MSVGSIGMPGGPPSFPDRQNDAAPGAEAENGFGKAYLEGRKIRPAQIKPHIDPSRVDPQMRQAAEGMEAMFLDQLFRVMRQTVPKGEESLEGPATDIYRSMLDTETAQRAAHAGGVGLSEQIIAYLQSQKYTEGRENVPAAPEGDGTKSQSR